MDYLSPIYESTSLKNVHISIRANDIPDLTPLKNLKNINTLTDLKLELANNYDHNYAFLEEFNKMMSLSYFWTKYTYF